MSIDSSKLPQMIRENLSAAHTTQEDAREFLAWGLENGFMELLPLAPGSDEPRYKMTPAGEAFFKAQELN